MSCIYQNEDTAIRHLKKGRYFFNTPFSKFWNKKEMFVTAVKLGFKPSDYACFRHRYEWYKTWCWEEDFVTELFDIVWNQTTPRERVGEMYWLKEYLPDRITSSDRYLSLCLTASHLYTDRATGAAYQSLVSDIERSDTSLNLQKLDSLFENHAELIKKDGEVVTDFMSSLLRYPSQIINDRKFCLQLARDYGHWGMRSLRPLQDDIDFAIDVVTAFPSKSVNGFSYGIRSFVKDGNPRELLPRLKIHNELENSLTKKPQVVGRKLNKV